jgi:hypothetical protein
MKLDDEIRVRVLGASAATLDRLLRTARAASGCRRSKREAKSAAQRTIAIRTFADWKEPAPGFPEIDLVCHAGETMAGSFVHTLCLTDIASGWTECVALLVRDSSLVVDALQSLRDAMPFPMLGIDSDNGSEFMNELVIEFCAQNRVELTRSRPSTA